MNLSEVAASIMDNARKKSEEDFDSIRVEFSQESHIGQCGVYLLDEKGNDKMISQGDYNLTKEESEFLKDYLISERKKGKQANELVLSINSNKEFSIETSWDQQKHEVNTRYRELMQEKKKRKTKPSKKKNNPQIDSKRFIASEEFACNKRVLPFDIRESKITAQLFARCYSFLNEKPDVNFEGFMFSITDQETGLSFGTGRTASGVGYYANNHEEKTIKNIMLFHQFLFSGKIELKECQISFEHDFGKIIIGYKDGQFFEIEELDGDN